jgi:release factor glutamine methyltransferase
MTPTLREAIRAAADAFVAAGVETPRLDAELLIAHVTGTSRTHLYAHPDDRLEPGQHEAFEALVCRRAAREPLPYLLGSWEWMGMQFRVTPAVLIPRPETETLVEEAARRLPPAARILDVGAGSGCIIAGLALLLPQARITALEPSPEASAVARENLRFLGFADRTEVIEAAFPAGAGRLRELDAVVSNPPYIPSCEVDRLAPELRLHEPRSALDGGLDGLDVLRGLATEAPSLLKPGGLLAVEVGQRQAGDVAELLRNAWRWAEPEVIRDLAGVERIVLARRAS